MLVFFAPYLRAIAHVHQFSASNNVLAKLADPAHQHGANIELPPHFPGINFRPPVTERGAPRHDLESGQSREVIDDTFGNAVREVLQGRIIAIIGERQDGDRVDEVVLGPRLSPSVYGQSSG